MWYKKITVEDDIRPYYQSSALAHKPCTRGTCYHALDCGHTVVDRCATGCASNCTEPGVFADGSSDNSSSADGMSPMDVDNTSSSPSSTNVDIDPDTFLCVLCVLKQYDPYIDSDTAPNDDVRSLLGSLGRAHFEDASEDLAAATAQHRYSEPSKPWDWLYDFLAQHPGAAVGEQAQSDDGEGSEARLEPDTHRRGPAGSGGPLAQVRVLLRAQAAENEKAARTMNWERRLLHGSVAEPC
ncbi:hypothetical protein PMIN02_009479 [Paraphaeosphaeria minitans]|uniref:Uncharacterized protein n=1 Tax=Paraphaeosphaeria minitans TaxID=565426 RepID=A0A9P6GLE4_9PLEO|nr:hypothetical protein PMIN01_05566 [Paraphaeosphaeria minitans]